ncbi:MAG: hypothetical protein ACOC2W_01475 [bacterium]
MEIGIIQLIITVLSLAMLAIQVSYSDLSSSVKKFLGLDIPYRYKALTNIYFWVRFFGLKTSHLLSPIVLLLLVFFKVHKFISEMLSCPYCVSYHMGWTTFYFYYNMTLFQSVILYAPLVLVGVAIIDRIMR